MARRDHEMLRAECELHGFTFHIWSPGDGATRYRFATLGTSSAEDFFAADGDFTALGLREARVYARGRIDGRERL